MKKVKYKINQRKSFEIPFCIAYTQHYMLHCYWNCFDRQHLRWHGMLLFSALIASRRYRWCWYTFLQWHSIAWYLWHKISLQVQTFKIALLCSYHFMVFARFQRVSMFVLCGRTHFLFPFHKEKKNKNRKMWKGVKDGTMIESNEIERLILYKTQCFTEEEGEGKNKKISWKKNRMKIPLWMARKIRASFARFEWFPKEQYRLAP